MSEPGQAPGDPSMEDILASIRRILAEGEDPPEETAPPIPLPPPEDVFVLDQTMMIEEPAPMPNATEPAPTPEPAAQEPPHDYSHLDAGAPPAEPLLAPGAAAASSASLGALVRVVSQRQTQLYRNGPTLEDMVRDEIRPLVKAWLDENLAPMVERLVRAEIERVSAAK